MTTGNKALPNGTKPDEPAQAAQPFGHDGEQYGAVSAEHSAPQAPSNETSEAKAQPAATAGAPAVEPVIAELRCRCGAEPHAEEPGICARGHALPGNKRTLKHGLFAARPVEEDGIDPELAGFSQSYRRSMEADLWRQSLGLVRSLNRELRERPRLVRNHRLIQQLVSLHQQARSIDAELRSATTEVPDTAVVVDRLVHVFATQEGAFAEMLRGVLAKRPDLLSEVLAVVAEVPATVPPPEPLPTAQGLPVAESGLPRMVDADADDEVFL